MLLEIIVLLITLWLYRIFREHGKRQKYCALPGPPTLPILGNLVQLIAMREPRPHMLLKYLSEQYGPVMKLQIGSSEQVVIDDYEIARKLLNSDEWADRYVDLWIRERSFGKFIGIFFGRGEEWKNLRKFTMRALRTLGAGKTKIQGEYFQEELFHTLNLINSRIKTEGNVLNMKDLFSLPVLNILWRMVAGERFSLDDERAISLRNQMVGASQAIGLVGNIAGAFPFLRHVIHWTPTGPGRRRQYIRNVYTLFKSLVDERRSSGNYKENPTDYIEIFLQEIDKAKANTKQFNCFTDEQMLVSILDLFSAGGETTSNALEFSFLLLILNPEVQKKIQDEIESVIGFSREPTVADMRSMSYTEATLLECMRFSCTVSLLPRSAKQDTKIGNYEVKKGTRAIINVHSIHFNERMWDDAKKFLPERFLNNQKIVNSEKLIFFGQGTRVCIGDFIAKGIMFLFITNFLQRYTLEKADGHELPSIDDPICGLTLSPKTYYALLKPRV